MRMILLLALTTAIASPALGHELEDLLSGTYTNTEQSYFQGEAGKEADPWLGLKIATNDDGNWRLQRVNAFSEPQAPAHDASIQRRGDLTALTIDQCTRLFRPEGEDFILESSEGHCDDRSVITRIAKSGLTLTDPEGYAVDMRRARSVSCWVSVRKIGELAEGEWTSQNGLQIHDQGGRARAAGGDSGAPETIIRMRNVIWPPPSRNRPSLVLYVHRADKPVQAVSYSWADPGANRIGINLRWMQASCTIQAEDDGGS